MPTGPQGRARSAEGLPEGETHGPLPEPLFLQALCLERKRAERSRRLFVLMVLHLGERVENSYGADVLSKSGGAISSLIRDTDIPGWYEQHSAFAVIFTELGAAGKTSALSALRERVTATLRSTLRTDELPHVHLSFHCFPEDWQDHETALPAIVQLYPDLAQRDEGKKMARVIKRSMDLAGSSLGLIALSPLFLAIAVAIKLSSPGPILFHQRRIGQYGVPFTFLKFRSMHTANDSGIHMEYIKRLIAGTVHADASGASGTAVYKITEDPRVTRVGRFLRRTSLDELPQFFNVFRGEMSLVGPRPPIPYEVDSYDIWHRRRVLEVKPGITGLWQVNGRSRLAFDDMVRLDLKYAETWSPWLDIKILLQTPRAVVSRDGAY